MRTNWFIFALFLTVWVACQSPSGTNEPEATATPKVLPAVPVLIEEVQRMSEAAPIISSGILASKEEKTLSFKVGGVIDRVYVEEGQSVRAGQVLARLNLSEINAQVTQAQSNLDKVIRDLERAQRLYEDTVVTLEQVQNLQTSKEVAEAQLDIATFNQSYATIRAAQSGTILTKFQEEGEVVNPGDPIVSWASTQVSSLIRTSLSDVDVVKINLGDTARVHFDAYPSRTFYAIVSEIAASANAQTGAFEVEAKLLPHTAKLKNGFIGKLQLYPRGESSEYLRIPMSALVEANEVSVWIHVPNEDQTIGKRMELSPYQIGSDYIAVPIDQYRKLTHVITNGTKYLKDGSDIKPSLAVATH